MRAFCVLVLACSLWLTPSVLGSSGTEALAQFHLPSSPAGPHMVLKAKFVCGVFDGSFTCKREPGAVEHRGGKIPGTQRQIPDSPAQPAPDPVTSAPGASNVDQLPSASAGPGASTCQNGMVGTPPNCYCPKNSELLGGRCIPYRAICQAPAPAESPIQPCTSAEEKLVCKTRQDGLRECCCMTYERL